MPLDVLAERALACVSVSLLHWSGWLCCGADSSPYIPEYLLRFYLHLIQPCIHIIDSSISDCRGFQSMSCDTNFETTLFNWRLYLQPVIGRYSYPDIPTPATFSVFSLRRLVSPTALPTRQLLDADSTSPPFLHCLLDMPRCYLDGLDLLCWRDRFLIPPG